MCECAQNGWMMVKGNVARAIIEGCLALQMLLIQDWLSSDGLVYLKSMATTLLGWTLS